MLNRWYGILVRLSVLVYSVIFWTAPESAKVPWRQRTFLINMADTCEIKCSLVPNTKVQSDLWKYFNLCEWKTDGPIDADFAVCKHCNSVVKCAGGTSNMSKHMKRYHPLSSFVFSSFSNWPNSTFGSKIHWQLQQAKLVCISRYLNILYWYGHRILVHKLVQFLYWYTALPSAYSAT